jgi:hypothetical protein
MKFNARSLTAAMTLTCCALLASAAIDASQNAPSPPFASVEEEFKYGSVGIESEEGMPYWIWQALPRVFADKMPRPGGYESFGFVWEPGRELPIGFSTAELFGGRRIAINCAFCHTGAYRLEPAGPRRIVAAGPGNLVNPQAYVRFLQTVAEDPRFNANDLLAAIDGMTRLSWMERIQYRWLLIPATRRALRRQKEQYAWANRNPDWGAGRIDPFNPVKFGILKQPIDTTIGNSDMVPLWNMKERRAMPLHWDGLTTSLHESVLSSAIGDGASRKSVALANLGRIEQWLMELTSPRYPLNIDAALAARGAPVFAEHCASCHAPGGKQAGAVIPVGEVGTDAHRLNMWTSASASAYNAFADGYQWDFSGFRKTNGYVAVPLNGLWLRAPYLHNGSVPSLQELLEPPDKRRKVFYRGYDLYDPMRGGFVSDGPNAERIGTRYDTERPGNGNGGHLYGVALAADEKRALIEFLKTL